jgi:VIT1/CCC1 family predicted Fe2+/Mn2+ transporter
LSGFFQRYLDPSERMAEVLFGVIMTLTFTLGGSLVIKEGPDATRELLVGVIGCNLAWGVIDGLLYIFGAMFARGSSYRAARLLAREGAAAAGERIDEHLKSAYGAALSAETRSNFRREVLEHLGAMKPERVKMTREDLLGASATFLLVALTAVPAVLPFLLFDSRMVALRVSNFLLVGLMFLIGYQWASYINASRWRIALGMAVGGLVLVQITIALGG